MRHQRNRREKSPDSNIQGVLPIIKPAGPTSHDIVQVARKALNTRAVGHTGTLDPAASGLLLLCIGAYTKLVPYLTESGKSYRGDIGLGLETTTDDREGAPTLRGDVGHLDLDRVCNHAKRFQGEIDQIPPRYAAVKVDGKKLYEYARQGIEVEIAPRPVTVYQFDILELSDSQPADEALLARAEPPYPPGQHIRKASFFSRVSSGTYVRSLARDLGRELGCGGYLASLERTAVGKFTTDQAMTVDELTATPELVENYMIRGAGALDTERFPVLTILTAYKDKVMRGMPLHDKMLLDPSTASQLVSGAVVGIADEDGALLCVSTAEHFDPQALNNPYGSRFLFHFKSLRVFGQGLK